MYLYTLSGGRPTPSLPLSPIRNLILCALVREKPPGIGEKRERLLRRSVEVSFGLHSFLQPGCNAQCNGLPREKGIYLEKGDNRLISFLQPNFYQAGYSPPCNRPYKRGVIVNPLILAGDTVFVFVF